MTPEERLAASRESAKRSYYKRKAEMSPEQASKLKADKLAYHKTWREKNKEKIAAWNYVSHRSDTARAYGKKWQQENRERTNQKSKRWRDTHPEQMRDCKQSWTKRTPEQTRLMRRRHYIRHSETRKQYSRMWVRLNRERAKATSDAWRFNNRDGVKVTAKIGKHRRRSASGTFTVKQFLLRVEYHGWRCVYCKCKLHTETVIIEHQIPIVRGGTNWPSNLVPSCRSCNCRKHSKTPSEYRRYIMEAAPPLISSTGLNVPSP